MTDLLFKITETQIQGAVRWQKRALAAEGRVVVLEAVCDSVLDDLSRYADNDESDSLHDAEATLRKVLDQPVKEGN